VLLGALLIPLFLQDGAELVARGRELLERQAFAAAERAFEDAVELDPSSSRAHYYLGVTRLRLGEAERAISALERARALSPRANGAVLFELGSALLQLTRYQEAVSVLSAASRASPGEMRFRLQLGFAYYQLVEGEKAAAEFRAVLGKEPENAAAHFYLGLSEAALGHLEAAEQSFRNALEQDATLVDARLGLARVLSQSGRRDEAKTELETVLRVFPAAAASAHNELGLIALRAGETVAAAEHFEAVLALEPEHRQATYNLSLLYRRLDLPEKAEAMRVRFEQLKTGEVKEPSLARTTSRKSR